MRYEMSSIGTRFGSFFNKISIIVSDPGTIPRSLHSGDFHSYDAINSNDSFIYIVPKIGISISGYRQNGHFAFTLIDKYEIFMTYTKYILAYIFQAVKGGRDD
jgi:hypothetical protein